MKGRRAPGWGAEWGTPGSIPKDAIEASSDLDAARLVGKARRAGNEFPPVVLRGGDLARTLGLKPSKELRDTESNKTIKTSKTNKDPEGFSVQVDVCSALVDGRLHWFIAHLVARRSWLRGRVLVVANASFIGNWNIAPRAHPGDGKVDVLDANPSMRVRLAARRRLPAGTHLPHPDIKPRRTAARQFDLGSGLDVYVDGQMATRARTLSVRVYPAALQVWIPSS